eukprot:PhF_6_TR21043/c0_g1_i3/m.30284/K20130/RABEP2; Rab GTPase-binding effector protein 2
MSIQRNRNEVSPLYHEVKALRANGQERAMEVERLKAALASREKYISNIQLMYSQMQGECERLRAQLKHVTAENERLKATAMMNPSSAAASFNNNLAAIPAQALPAADPHLSTVISTVPPPSSSQGVLTSYQSHQDSIALIAMEQISKDTYRSVQELRTWLERVHVQDQQATRKVISEAMQEMSNSVKESNLERRKFFDVLSDVTAAGKLPPPPPGSPYPPPPPSDPPPPPPPPGGLSTITSHYTSQNALVGSVQQSHPHYPSDPHPPLQDNTIRTANPHSTTPPFVAAAPVTPITASNQFVVPPPLVHTPPVRHEEIESLHSELDHVKKECGELRELLKEQVRQSQIQLMMISNTAAATQQQQNNAAGSGAHYMSAQPISQQSHHQVVPSTYHPPTPPPALQNFHQTRNGVHPNDMAGYVPESSVIEFSTPPTPEPQHHKLHNHHHHHHHPPPQQMQNQYQQPNQQYQQQSAFVPTSSQPPIRNHQTVVVTAQTPQMPPQVWRNIPMQGSLAPPAQQHPPHHQHQHQHHQDPVDVE